MFSYESLQRSQPLDMAMNHALDRSNVTDTQCDTKESERNDEIALRATRDDSYTKGFSLVVKHNTISVEHNMLNTICCKQAHQENETHTNNTTVSLMLGPVRSQKLPVYYRLIYCFLFV